MSTTPEQVEEYNRAARELYESLPWTDPVGCVQWVHLDEVRPNDYNPNSVPHKEMTLLHTSIEQDGYTQPVVTVWDDAAQVYRIIDGFHRYTVMVRFPDIAETTGGYLPVVVLDKSLADRIASTVRHNRARGKHSTTGMSNLVFEMLEQGESDSTICNKLGLEAEELARLKYITGFAKLFHEETYSKPALSQRQVEAKAAYKREHPDETVPTF